MSMKKHPTNRQGWRGIVTLFSFLLYITSLIWIPSLQPQWGSLVWRYLSVFQFTFGCLLILFDTGLTKRVAIAQMGDFGSHVGSNLVNSSNQILGKDDVK